jgi:LYR motif-containing protein 4
MTAVSRNQVLGLYASMLRAARKWHDYNFRSHALRRIKYGFRENINKGSDEVPELYERGQQQLNMLTRQAVLSQLYPMEPSVLENIIRKLKHP